MTIPRIAIGAFLLDALLPQPLTAADPPPEVLWKVAEDGKSTGLSDPLVAGQFVIVGTDVGFLRAFKVATGEEVWRYSLGVRIYARPDQDDDRIYAIGENNGAVAVRRNDGSLVWSRSSAQGYGALAVSVDDGLVFLAGNDGNISAHDAATGEVRWTVNIVRDAPRDPPGFDGSRARFEGKAARPTAAVCAGGCVFVSVFDQSRVVGFDVADGSKKFDYQTGGWVLHSAVIDGDRVFIGSQDRAMHCVDRTTSKPFWSFRTEARIESSAAVDNGRVYFGSCDGRFYCLDRESGDEVWAFDSSTGAKKKSIYSDPLIIDDMVCFAAGEGQVYGLDLASGKLRWKLRPVDDSELFSTPANKGTLLFITSRPALDAGGKPTTGKNALAAIDLYVGR